MKHNSLLKCSFCSKTQDQVNKLIAGPEIYICDECVGLCSNLLHEELIGASTPASQRTASLEKARQVTSLSLEQLPKPREIKQYLDKYVIGQDEAKKV